MAENELLSGDIDELLDRLTVIQDDFEKAALTKFSSREQELVKQAVKYPVMLLWSFTQNWDLHKFNELLIGLGLTFTRDLEKHFRHNMPYADYLLTEHWQKMRLEALERASHRCQVCNSSTTLNVHHRTYERRGNELTEDLIVLCQSCHQLFHDNGKLQVEE